MTKVLLRYRLLRPLDETLMQSIAAAHGVYGIHSVKLAPSLDEITVEYDASRLTPEQVEAALHRAGIPAVKEA
jgi:copper chaperone CopZ